MSQTYTYTDTPGFLKLAHDSLVRNQGPNPKLLGSLDPDGLHLLMFKMLHNDHEWRGVWMCKLSDAPEPVVVLMDNGMTALESCTEEVEVTDEK